MADEKHEHGTMNIEMQERAFDGFMRWVTNGTIVIIVVLILMALFLT